jgi:hypothetical protein
VNYLAARERGAEFRARPVFLTTADRCLLHVARDLADRASIRAVDEQLP